MKYALALFIIFSAATASADAGLLCATNDSYLQPAPCHPLYEANCPPNICAIQYPNGGCVNQVLVNECEYADENGVPFWKLYCAAYETVSQLWAIVFKQTFPYARSIYCDRR